MEWFSQEPHSLLTGSFDQTAVVLDCRTQKKVLSMKLGATPESLAISPFDTTKVFVTTESGHLKQFDVRNAGKAMWSVKAHTSEAAGLAVNPGVNGLVATGGVDSEVKLWDVRADPVALASRNLQQGRVFSLHFSPDRPAYLLASGDAGKPLVYCVTQDVSSAFGVPSQGAHQAATSSSSP
ncbi:putative WD repeat-containing protein C17D11.16 [Diplonema papillatum]|nr:putative WD repeat-containing protein C17D11.16 [Diplonema papillatum]